MGKKRVLDFVPCPLSHIPKPVIDELKIVFNDLGDGVDESGKAGRRHLLPEEIRAAFIVNAVDVRDEVVDAALASMDPGKTGKVNFEGFATCIYALSIQSRKVRNAGKYAVFPDSDFTVETASALFRTRRLIWKLLEDPASSPLARTIAFFLSSVVLLSVTSFLAESYPEVRQSNEALFSGIELACVLVFTIEYILRLTCTPELSKFFFSFYNMVDLLSIAPYYLELILEDSGTSLGSGAPLLRAVRLIRILRLIKLGRYVAWMRIFGATVENSASPLGLLAFMAGIMIILWSSLGYFVERGEWDAATQSWINPETGAPSFITSIPSAFWWAIVSMTTVGYGDTFAVTGWGRLISGAAIITGVALFAIPISIVTSNLHAEYDRMDKLRALRAAHEAQPIPLPLAALAALQQEELQQQQAQLQLQLEMEEEQQRQQQQLGQESTGFPRKYSDSKSLLQPGDFDLPSPPQASAIRSATSLRFGASSGSGSSSSSAATTGTPSVLSGTLSLEEAAVQKAKLSETLLKASLSSANLQDLVAAEEASNIVARGISEKVLPGSSGGTAASAVNDKKSPRLSLFGGNNSALSPSFRGKGVPTPPLASSSSPAKSPILQALSARPSILGSGRSGDSGKDHFFDGVHMLSLDRDPYQRHLVRQSLVEIAAETSGGVDNRLAEDLDSAEGPFTLDSRMNIVTSDKGFSGGAQGGASENNKDKDKDSAGANTAAVTDSLDFELGPPAVAGALPSKHHHLFHNTSAAGSLVPSSAVAVPPLALSLSSSTSLTTTAGAGRPFLPMGSNQHQHQHQHHQDVQLPQSSLEDRLDASWSEPFLRSALQVIRGNRRRLMSGLKALELKNREHAVEDVRDFVGDLHEEDRIKALLLAASRSGFA